MDNDDGRVLRSGTRTPAGNSSAPDATPQSGNTTTTDTNTWSKGTGNNTDRDLSSDAINTNKTPIQNADSIETLTPKNVPRANENPAATENTNLSVLLAELELRKAELIKAKAVSAEAQTRLEIARIEAARSVSSHSIQGEPASRVEGWVNQQLNVKNRTKISIRESGRNGELNVDPLRQFENKDLELMSSKLEAAVSRKNTPIIQSKIPELSHFSGALTDWIPFKAEYLDTESLFTDVMNVGRIRRSLRGEARQAVKSILYTVSDPNEIMDCLEMQFGNPEAIILAEIEEVKRLPRLADDCHNIITFAGQVANVVASIKALKQDQYLLAPELVGKLVDKMNPIIRHEWNKYRLAHASIPSLVALSTFLNETSRASGLTRRPPTRSKHNVHTARQTRDDSFSPSRSRSRDSRGTEPRSRTNTNRVPKKNNNVTKQTATQGNKPFINKKKDISTQPRSQDKPTKCIICSGEHAVAKCADFIKMNINDRWSKAREFKLCFRCLNASHRRPFKCAYVPCGMSGCEAGHNKLLHGITNENQTRNNVAKINHIKRTETYLKMLPVELHGPYGTTEILALCDEGSSLSILEREVADKLAPRGQKENLILEGIGGNVVTENESCRLELTIRGKYCRNLEKINVCTIDHLNLSPQKISRELVENCPHLNEIRDQLCYDEATPSLLIGQDNWHLIVSRQILSGNKSQLAASRTAIGWSVHGQMSIPRQLIGAINHVKHSKEQEIYDLIKQHFSIESLGIEPRVPKSDPDRRALEILNATCAPIPGEKRFQAGLLWKNDTITLPNNRDHALKRLYNLERKLDKEDSLKLEYSKQIQNLLDKGYAEKVDSAPTSNRTFYLPHFAVTHPQKLKPRLVFDGSAKYQNVSLNDALLTGPDMIKSLFGVLIRFREGRIGLISDIREMFLQVRIIESDRDSLRFLWRGEDRQGPVQEYRMTSLIFGSASSPSTAIFVKNKNAENHSEKYPHVYEKTVKNFYVDDLLASFDKPQEAKRLVTDINKVFQEASFQLCGWASNEPEVIRDVIDTTKNDTTVLGKCDYERTLGLLWNSRHDTLGFNVNFRNTPLEILNGTKIPTKRQVTSGVMSLFDPTGFVTPVTVTGKVLIQEMWRAGTSWDQCISHEHNEMWRSFVESIHKLRELEIERYVIAPTRQVIMHTFCDSSETIYAAATYMVGTDENGKKYSALVAARARVTPLKKISIPRLELQAAVLGSRLAKSIKNESSYDILESHYWTDSRTVLAWIKSDPRTFKSFVAHRLSEIEDNSLSSEWRWVPTALNVSDDATRGVPTNFDKNHRWFHGPDFIKLNREHWPVEKNASTPELISNEEKIIKKVLVITKNENFTYLPDVSRYSKYIKLLRVTARTLLAAEVFKALMLKRYVNKNVNNEHMKIAELLLVKRSQRESFTEDIKHLEAGRPVPRKSMLHKIAVKLNDHGVLLLEGRIDRDQSTPVLYAKEPLTKLIIAHYHAIFNHGNHATVMNELQKSFHIIGLRGAIRYISNTCQWCRVHRGTPLKVPLGDLPSERLTANQPAFTATACDYFGPMHITVGRRHEKRWGVLFTCLTTRAVHLELAASLSASSMILALRRLMARRGTPTVLYSDNATNFVGSEREIKEAADTIDSEMRAYATSKQIIWKKIPPGNPSAGGAWERLVGSVKTALRVTLKERFPQEEVLHTLLLEAEHIINSRPLTPVVPCSTQEALTPNHFLLGRSNAMSPFGSFSDITLTEKSWKSAQALADSFWTRWVKEYRQTLRPRNMKNAYDQNVKVGDIVIIADGTMPRGTWPRGEVEKVYPGPDGRVRVTEIRTAAGMIRRPASRLIVIYP